MLDQNTNHQTISLNSSVSDLEASDLDNSPDIRCSTTKKQTRFSSSLKNPNQTIKGLIEQARMYINNIGKSAAAKNANIKNYISKTRACLTEILTIDTENKSKSNNSAELLRTIIQQTQPDICTSKHLAERMAEIRDSQNEVFDILNRQMGYMQHLSQQYHKITQQLNIDTDLEEEILPKHDKTPESQNSIYSEVSNTSELERTPLQEKEKNTKIIRTSYNKKEGPDFSTPITTIKNKEEKGANIIVIRAKGRKMRAEEISRAIDKAHIVTQAQVIEKLLGNSEVKLLCKTKQDSNQLLKDLQSTATLTRNYKVSHYTPFYQKSILLNVPEQFDEKYIHDSISNEYEIRKDDLRILRNQPSRAKGEKNWIVLLVPSLLKAIIEDRGLLLGPSKYLMRPLTTILRCKNCQIIGHSTKSCKNQPQCDNCGVTHMQEECKASASCVNCRIDNNTKKSSKDLQHRASSLDCPTYQHFYKKERQRLNEQYLNFTKNNRPEQKERRGDFRTSCDYALDQYSQYPPYGINTPYPYYYSYENHGRVDSVL